MDEKKKAMDRILNSGDRKTGYVIVCSNAKEIPKPDAGLANCACCDVSIWAYNVSLDKRKEGFYLLCKECFALLLEKLNKRGTSVRFEGRIRNNQFPQMREEKQ